jgi:hypothetical protein
MLDKKKLEDHIEKLAQDFLYYGAYQDNNFRFYQIMGVEKFGDSLLADMNDLDNYSFIHNLAMYFTAAKLKDIDYNIILNYVQKLITKNNDENLIIPIAFLFYEYILMLEEDNKAIFNNIDSRYLEYAKYMSNSDSVDRSQNYINEVYDQYRKFIEKTEGRQVLNEFFYRYNQKTEEFSQNLKRGNNFELLKSTNLEQLGKEILEDVDFYEHDENDMNHLDNALRKYIAITMIGKTNLEVIQNFIRKLLSKEITDNRIILLISALFRDYIIDMEEELKSLDVDSRYLKYVKIIMSQTEQPSKNIEEIPDESIDAIFKSIFGQKEEEAASSSAVAASSDINPMNILLTRNQTQSNRRLQVLNRQINPRDIRQINPEDYSSQKDVYRFNERNGKFN